MAGRAPGRGEACVEDGVPSENYGTGGRGKVSFHNHEEKGLHPWGERAPERAAFFYHMDGRLVGLAYERRKARRNKQERDTETFEYRRDLIQMI